jgi:TolB-like protein
MIMNQIVKAKNTVKATAMMPVSVMYQKVYTVFWVFIVSWVTKLSKLSKLNKLYGRKCAFCSVSLALSSLLIVSGCVSGSPKHYVRQQVDYKSIKRIAVLPFETLTSDEFAGEKIRKSAITELLSRGIDVIEPGEVTRTLVELKIRSLGSIKTTDIQNIAKALGVEALMMGSVEAYGISKGISVSYPEVSINLRLVEASSGNTMWSVCHTSGGAGFWTRHFGAEGISLSEAASKVVKEAIDTMY